MALPSIGIYQTLSLLWLGLHPLNHKLLPRTYPLYSLTTLNSKLFYSFPSRGSYTFLTRDLLMQFYPARALDRRLQED